MSISRIQDTRGIGNVNAPRRPRNSMVAEPKQPEDAKKYRFAKGGKNWIAGAVKKPGALRKELGVKGDKPIPAKKLAAAAKKPGKLGKRARLAETFKAMKK